jgi:hypothetical protein
MRGKQLASADSINDLFLYNEAYKHELYQHEQLIFVVATKVKKHICQEMI